MSSLDPPSPPSISDELRLDFPAEHVLLLTLNRPWALNAMTPTMAHDLERVLNWFESEPRLWVAVVTGAGRLFCAGADLKAWNERTQNGGETNEQERIDATLHGFGSISRRISSKPIVAAVIGGAYGGGMEMLVNCDIIVASSDAKFSFPEVKRGVVAVLGGIPRIARICGHQVGLAFNMDKPQHSRASLDANGISNLLLSSHGASVYVPRPPFPIIVMVPRKR